MGSPLRKILITAGPTREMLDPVRFISNLSTGEMGYTLARMAKQAGYDVTLISGPTMLAPPPGVRFIPITSARELQLACQKQFPRHNVLIMTAAVCDFTSAKVSRQKIRRTRTHELLLEQTPDIVAGLAKKKGHRKVIGFCLETEDWIGNAKRKLVRKNLDGIVANFYSVKHVPFGNRRITTAFLSAGPDGKCHLLKNKSKMQISRALLKWIERLSEKSFQNAGK